MSVTLIVAVFAAVVGPLAGYLGASRKLSGRINTSEASELWAESTSIREDYRQRLAAAEARTAAMEARIAHLEQVNNDLVRENIGLRSKLLSLGGNE